jgi:hypothetical protein
MKPTDLGMHRTHRVEFKWVPKAHPPRRLPRGTFYCFTCGRVFKVRTKKALARRKLAGFE